ncbi:MAG TPA: type VI secretion system tube protein Hcp [Alphaproteobacteria bacterium]|nr:type VI secretion system tube protein Hcp [Alphaproteobacteria bacterium]
MAIDAFLKIDGIPGESTDDKHKNWIEIESYAFSVTQPVSVASATGGRTASRVSINDFQITKVADKSSPHLLLACCDGRHIKEVKVEVCEASQNKHTYLVYTMNDVVVSSVQPAASKGSEKPLDAVSFNFGKITWEYTPLNQDGSPGSKVGPMGWDLTKNSKV